MNAIPFKTLSWLNPSKQQVIDDTLSVTTGQETDFWRETFYGFIRDSGHFGFVEAAGDFSAEVSFRGDYQALYDQAGMMLRLDETTWLKAGIEYTDGQQHLSVVVTRGVSDWSVLPLATAPDEVRLRLTRLGSAVLVQYSLDEQPWAMLRLAALTDAETLQVGVMCCSPQRAGFEVTFRDFWLGEPVTKDLHAS
jgi:regulation of enolase protein 1 (concanavalin A-like superfamily)